MHHPDPVIQSKLNAFLTNLIANHLQDMPERFFVLTSSGAVIYTVQFESRSLEKLMAKSCMDNDFIALPMETQKPTVSCAVFDTLEKAIELRNQLIELNELNKIISPKIQISYKYFTTDP